MENLLEALKLMVVGMTTVFLILLIVINLGKLLIAAVNRWAPEESATKKVVTTVTNAVDARTMEVLHEAVKQITGGKGHLVKAEKK